MAETIQDNAEHAKWPASLLLARHGQSAGNVARDAAEAQNLAVIDIAGRDMDVPLSELGERQANALGEWLFRLEEGGRPTVALCSPYKRARDTAQIALNAAGLGDGSVPLIVDERLREKEFGVLDRLTPLGIQEHYPEQAAFRKALGKFYHRPPGGESWCDVILRLRSVLDTLTREHRGERVFLVAHQVVVLCFRYLMERMTEEQVLAIDKETQIANCAVTLYEFDGSKGRHGKMALRLFNFAAPMEEAHETVTAKPDVPVAPK